MVDKPGHIGLDGVKGHTAHRSALLQAAALAGQRDLQNLTCLKRIVKEHLIEVTQTIKKDAVRVLCLGIQIILHHG